jgi:ABC-type transport system involved in multi-copper enzyme maturation permease subunit
LIFYFAFHVMPLAFELPPFIDNYLIWWVTALIVLVGLVASGFDDLKQFTIGRGFQRAWAISGICFKESIRRRVLWITPLAIIGVLAVSQLQKSADAQDVIRQTIKVSLFASGFLVVVSIVILACTNLPREIENRVIYTIVTKPTTRLEIVVGKVIGFARVSAMILLIMGVFTYAYVRVRAWQMLGDIDTALTTNAVETTMAPTLRHYQQEGLLTAQTLAEPLQLQVYSRLPNRADARKYIFGGGEGTFLVPFQISRADLIPPGSTDGEPGSSGVGLILHIGFEPSQYGHDSQPPSDELEIPRYVANPHPPTKTPKALTAYPRKIGFQVLNAKLNQLIRPNEMENGEPLLETPASTEVRAFIPPENAKKLAEQPVFYVQISGGNRDAEYFVSSDRPIVAVVPGMNGQPDRTLAPASFSTSPGPWFRGKVNPSGDMVFGSADGKAPIGVFSFRNAKPRTSEDQVSFEVKFAVERASADPTEDSPTRMEVTVASADGATVSDPINVYPESSRAAFFSVPRAALESGNFDVRFRCLTDGQYVAMSREVVQMVLNREPFWFNLAKSLTVLWLLALLVVIISIFCSTFVSWPIAIMLTLVILLGRWGVTQLGDAIAPGVGNQIASDMGFRDPGTAKVVSTSVEKLTLLLNFSSKVLPDITQFSAIDDIERGVSLPGATLLDSLLVILSFGISMIVMSYIFLKNKEVAP